jgi:tripartite-type tricarboxylate transporter receptor subunit TctC
MAATVGSVIPHIQSKRLRPLGVTSNHRVSQFPDIPTLAEGGVKGYEFTAWIGAFAPAATPRPIVDRLNAELKKAISVPEVAKILSSQTLDPMHMTPEQFAERLRSDYAKYERVIKSSGASID